MGVTETDATPKPTEAVYDVALGAKTGLRVPAEIDSADRSLLPEAARVTVTV